jgi:hypothetical protein
MNTGAILNRINFGMAVAANRLPGATLASLPGIDTLRNAPRGEQVDAAVAMLLSGSVSPDTRAVLMKGENPLAGVAAAAPSDAQPVQMAMGDAMPAGNRPNAGPGSGKGGGLGGGGGLRANAQARGLGNVPQLSGMAQIIGLALGSPEFQRR